MLPILEAIGMSAGENRAVVDHLKNAKDFMEAIAGLGGAGLTDGKGGKHRREPTFARDADYRVLDSLLGELDSSRYFRGMKKRLSPRNLVLWMSPEVADFHTPIEARGPWNKAAAEA